MPRLKVTATCTATVTEEWIVDITDEEYADLVVDETTRHPSVVMGMTATDENLRDGLIDIGTYVNVENVEVEHEREREIVGFELVADDFTNAVATVGLT